jgi:phage terminase small subunit
MFCVYFAEWVACNEDIAVNGYYQAVPLTNGEGSMERIRPVVKMREIAFANVMELSGHFGLTPADEYSLFATSASPAQNNPGLFDDGRHRPPEAAQAEAPAGGCGPAPRDR